MVGAVFDLAPLGIGVHFPLKFRDLETVGNLVDIGCKCVVLDAACKRIHLVYYIKATLLGNRFLVKLLIF